MKANVEVLNRELQKSLTDLRKLGTAIRQDLRTAGVDARQQWKKLVEPQLASAEKLVHEIGQASRAAVARTAAAFGEFKSSLETRPPRQRKVRAARRQARR